MAGTLEGRLLCTADKGERWQNINFLLADTGWDKNMMCDLAHYGDTFYGVGWYGAHRARFFKGSNNGNTWTHSCIDTSLASGLVDVVALSADTLFASGSHVLPGGMRACVVIRRCFLEPGLFGQSDRGLGLEGATGTISRPITSFLPPLLRDAG